jgi:intracellular sulfur oxidation DsrE/DsrF family protein
MKKIIILALSVILCNAVFSQKYNSDSGLLVLRTQKDSTLRALKAGRDSVYLALLHADSVRVRKEFKERESMEKLKGVAIFPLLKAGDFSGVIPVKDPAEIPDPNIEYKLLFELVMNNPDSVISQMNSGLVELARKINLHIASGIPLKKIIPVVVVHGPALYAFALNDIYKEKYKVDNPNLKLINELSAIGTRFIACGQAMAFQEIKKEALLPVIKVSLTAQTALSHYQLKGFVLFHLD